MSYKIVFLPRARKDFDEWKKTDEKTIEKIKETLRDISEHSFSGIGKPEPLKHNLSGKWSRRINRTDRIIYSVDGKTVLVLYLLHANSQYKIYPAQKSRGFLKPLWFKP